MKQIPLSQGKFALVDDEWFDYLNQWKWCYNNGYAMRSVVLPNKTKLAIMHRVVTGAPDGMIVDHIDHNGLNNQESNLRLCTNTENCHNARPSRGGTSAYKGVSWHKQPGKWRATIRTNGKSIHLGHFPDEISAAKAYDDAAHKHFGAFAHTNF